MKDTGKAKLKKAAVFVTVGVEVAGSVGAGAIIGYFIDQWLGTAPLILILLVLLVTVAVFWRIFRLLRWVENSDE